MFKFGCLLILALFGAVICAPGQYDKEHTWVHGNLSEPLPKNALIGGINSNANNLFVGRVWFNASILPAGIEAETGKSKSYINNVIFNTGTYELLVTKPDLSYDWVRSYDGHLEEYSISVGTTYWSERAFICRTIYRGDVLIGTLILSDKVCYVEARSFDKYEVLIAKPKLIMYYHNSTEINKN